MNKKLDNKIINNFSFMSNVLSKFLFSEYGKIVDNMTDKKLTITE